jgi:hypothetical protein
MHRTQNHRHRLAGTSITKAALQRAVPMHPATAPWSQKTSAGFSR